MLMSEGPGHGASVLLRCVLGLSVVSMALTVEQEPLMHVEHGWLAHVFSGTPRLWVSEP